MEVITYLNSAVSREKVQNRKKYTQIHYHNDYELYYLIDGETKYFIGDEVFQVQKGNLIFVPKGVIHKTDSEECMHNERFLLSFGDELFDENSRVLLEELSRSKLIYIPPNQLPYVDEAVRKIEKEYSGNREHREIQLRLYILELLVLLCRLKSECRPKLSETEKMILAVSDYIRDNFANELSLKLLSKQFAISEAHLSRKFKSVTGVGVNEFITYVRISNAEALLSGTDLSVTEIAGRCGYGDSNYFASVFKKIKGITPHRYAALQKQTGEMTC